MREACISDITAELVSAMDLNFSEAQGLMNRLLNRRSIDRSEKSATSRHRRHRRRRSGVRSRDTQA